jgi:hypothetical protein
VQYELNWPEEAWDLETLDCSAQHGISWHDEKNSNTMISRVDRRKSYPV